MILSGESKKKWNTVNYHFRWTASLKLLNILIFPITKLHECIQTWFIYLPTLHNYIDLPKQIFLKLPKICYSIWERTLPLQKVTVTTHLISISAGMNSFLRFLSDTTCLFPPRFTVFAELEITRKSQDNKKKKKQCGNIQNHGDNRGRKNRLVFKGGIVGTGELPAGNHSGHAAWELCRETGCSQGLICPDSLLSPVLFPARKPYHPTFSYRSKNPFPLSEYYTQLHTCGTSTSLPLLKRRQSLAFTSSALMKFSIWNFAQTSRISSSSLSLFTPLHFLPNFHFLKTDVYFEAIAAPDFFCKSLSCFGNIPLSP